MTMHLVMKEIEAGRASYDDYVTITEESWALRQPRGSSLMFLEPGQKVTLREIMLGLAVPSGNDAAVAAALHLAPTVAEFTAMMVEEARRMGMKYTRFTEPAGISSRNRTTAADFALFSRQYLELYPDSLAEFHSVRSFSYPLAANVSDANRLNPRTITQNNSNTLLRTFPGVDGLKTGFIGASGHNIALTAERDNTRFILILLGATTASGGVLVRNDDSARLLTWAFNNFKTIRPPQYEIEESVLLEAPLWLGRADKVELKLTESVNFTSHVNRGDSLFYEVVINETLIAPLPAGFNAGYLCIKDEYGELNRIPLVTAASYERGNVFKRLWHSVVLLLRR